MKTTKTNIMRGALCSIVALTALPSCTTSQTAAPQGTSPITWTTSGKPSGKMDDTNLPKSTRP